MDPFGRTIDYLRISVTDRCNERCLYCMPEGYKGWERNTEHLSASEIIRIVGAAADLGFRKFRLTGGEPLMRDDLLDIVRVMSKIRGVESIGLSTNGMKLAAAARHLRESGLRSVNVSLDALDPKIYHRVTGGNVEKVLAGIRAAAEAGFERVKLDCVLMRGVNEQELWPLALFAAEHRLPLRLIELMPLTSTEVLTEKNFLPCGEAMQWLAQKDELVPQPDSKLGHGPARYYLLKQTGAVVGFIGAMTNEHFCDQCNKMRLTADGRIRPCLGNHIEVDLRSALRRGANDAELKELLQTAVRLKPLEHQFRQNYQPCRPMTAIGG
jgi:GTP 3',8-cyclase